MSLILDALKRAERERRGEAPPAHPEVPLVSAGTSAPQRGRDLVYAGVVIGGLALSAVLLWDAFRAKPVPAAPPAAPAPAPVQAQAPAPSQPANVIVARPAPPPAAVVPGTEEVTSLDDLTDESTLEGPRGATAPPPKPLSKPDAGPSTIKTRPAPPPATAGAAEVQPAPQPKAPVPAPAPEVRKDQQPAAAAPAQPQPSPPDAGPATPAAAEPGPASATANIPPALTQPAPLKKFREMPPDYRADFPALKVEIHVYEKDAQRRFVMVNGRKYREGERLAEGPSLVEIVPEGLVLEYRGEKVLYTLGR